MHKETAGTTIDGHVVRSAAQQGMDVDFGVCGANPNQYLPALARSAFGGG